MKSLKCVNATNGLRVNNDGTAMFCCMSTLPLTDKSGDLARVSTTSLDSILNGKRAIEIRKALDNGVKHSNCKRCWDEESVGVLSKRIRDNKDHKYDDSELRLVELNLGTACNLKCRTCSPWASSQWNKEYLLVNKWHGSEAEYKSILHNLNHSYDDDSAFWNNFKEKLSTITSIDMYGGEPFMVKKQWELLQYSIDQGYSKHQKLHFNTNGTHFDDEKINILTQFKHVDISVSVDGLDKQFEYQRHPANWDIALSNIKKFKECANRYNWSLAICITVGNYNVWYLDTILDFFEQMNINAYLNFLHEPKHFNITNLRNDLKNELNVRYTRNTLSDLSKMWLKKALDYMNACDCDINEWATFLQITNKLDSIRLESFKTTFPEYYERIRN